MEISEYIGPRRAIKIRNSAAWLINGNKLTIRSPELTLNKTENLRQNAMNDLVNKITTQKIPCFFISPHLDDAVLSAGALINYLATRTDTTVITIFTQGSSNIPQPSWLKKCGYEDASLLFSDRQREDQEALNKLGINRVVHLGFVDAAWRTGNKHNLGTSLSEHEELLDLINTSLSKFIDTSSPYLTFFPIANGRKHLDHRLTNHLSNFFPESSVFWKEFSLKKDSNGKPAEMSEGDNMISGQWLGNYNEKANAILAYKSQLHALFPLPHLQLPTEEYYFPKRILNNEFIDNFQTRSK